MSDQPVSPAATYFDTTGKAASGGGLRHSFKELADILRALGLPREVRTQSPIPAEVQAALGIPAGARSAEWAEFTATACFENILGTATGFGPEIKDTELPAPPPQTGVPIQVTTTIFGDPYRILSGNILVDPNDALSGWRVTQGDFDFGIGSDPGSLYIVGQYFPIVAEDEPADISVPPPYVAIYGTHYSMGTFPGYFLNSSGGLWNCNTLFKGWQACPLGRLRHDITSDQGPISNAWQENTGRPRGTCLRTPASGP
jgi:hypothetical protein